MTETTLDIACMAVSELATAALISLREVTVSVYEPLTDAEEDAVTDYSDEIVFVLTDKK